MKKLSHIDKQGNAKMVDISNKQKSFRKAKACATISMNNDTISLIQSNELPKGNVFTTAKIAGIQAAKRTSELIPFCHQLQLSHIDISFFPSNNHIKIISTVKTKEATGVEMEAITSVSVAAITIYDMCKAVDKLMKIGEISLLEKKGGKSEHLDTHRPKVGIITMSDGVVAGERENISGEILVENFRSAGCEIKEEISLEDGSRILEKTIKSMINSGIELIISTGGTGLGPRDLTIPIVERLFDYRLHGVEQALHSNGRKTVSTACLSRLAAGVIKQTIMICLPGSTGAVKDGSSVLIPMIFHAFHMMKGEGHK